MSWGKLPLELREMIVGVALEGVILLAVSYSGTETEYQETRKEIHQGISRVITVCDADDSIRHLMQKRGRAVELAETATKSCFDLHKGNLFKDLSTTTAYRRRSMLDFLAFAMNWAMEQINPDLQIINYSWRIGDATATSWREEWLEIGEKPASAVKVNSGRNAVEFNRGRPVKGLLVGDGWT